VPLFSPVQNSLGTKLQPPGREEGADDSPPQLVLSGYSKCGGGVEIKK